MEALQCKDEIVQSNDEAMNLIPEQNRILKRNIGELAIDGKLNEDLKSPARKEVKMSHETYIRRELDQWKKLLKDEKFQKPLTSSGTAEMDAEDSLSILTPEQKSFIADRVDLEKFVEESHEFRRRFDFFLRVNKFMINTKMDKANEALDKAKQQAIQFRTDYMHCERFNPIEN